MTGTVTIDPTVSTDAAIAPPAQIQPSGTDVVVDDSDPGYQFRRVFGWIALIGALVWGTFMGGFLAYHTLRPDGWMVGLVEQQFAAIILVPMCGLGALCLVLVLRLSSGPLEFKAIGFEFRGASGQVVLWVVCFVALIAAVKLLWVAP